MVTKIKIEPEEVQLSTSCWGEQAEEQVKEVESEESFDSDEIDDEFLSNYYETAEIPHPMTVSKELFYTDEMVARNYMRNYTRNYSIERNKKVSKVIGTTHTTNAISKIGKGDSSGSQSIFALPKWCNIGIAGVCGGLPGGIIGRF